MVDSADHCEMLVAKLAGFRVSLPNGGLNDNQNLKNRQK